MHMQFDMIFFLIKYKIEIIYRHTIPLKRQANKLEETWEESTDVKVRVSLVGLPYVSMYVFCKAIEKVIIQLIRLYLFI